MRRPASSSPRRVTAPRHLIAALLVLAPGAASAQYMAHTAPPKAEAAPIVAPEARKPMTADARTGEQVLGGRLPNQRTGPSRQRTVRDICIGCDR